MQKGDSRTLFLAKGIETALSVAKAVPEATVVAGVEVNPFKNRPVGPELQKIVMCADAHKAGARATKSIIEAVDYYLSQGRQVFLALPEISRGIDKYDFNDLLKKGGIAAVQHALEQMVEIKNVTLLKREGLLAAFQLPNRHGEKVLSENKPLGKAQSLKVEKQLEGVKSLNANVLFVL